jgi:hypothetical protein
MTDPRPQLQALCARWLDLLAQARADGAALIATEHALTTVAARYDDPEIGVLTAAVREQRAALIDTIESIEHGIAVVREATTTLGRAYVGSLVDRARRR